MPLGDIKGCGLPSQPTFVMCDTYQACRLNMKMPPGFKLEVDEVVIKAIQQRLIKQKKAQKVAQKAA